MKVELNAKELEVYRSRSERYPGQPGLKYELGLRLQRAGNFNEAIKNYQEARGDAKRKSQVLLGLAECFYAIKQYKLSLSNFEAAVQETSDRDPEQQKFVLYQTGKLSLGLKEWKKAEKYLTELAGIDFGYRDTSTLLDKLSEIRDDG